MCGKEGGETFVRLNTQLLGLEETVFNRHPNVGVGEVEEAAEVHEDDLAGSHVELVPLRALEVLSRQHHSQLILEFQPPPRCPEVAEEGGHDTLALVVVALEALDDALIKLGRVLGAKGGRDLGVEVLVLPKDTNVIQERDEETRIGRLRG